ncbi:DUF4148 domain-containing protein [Burkholderia stagnalis]
MKIHIGVLMVAGLAIGQAACAQSIASPTRAQVREELVRLEAAGYTPAKGDDAEYPADIQAAEAKVAAQAGMAISAANAMDAGAPMRSGN